jgi:hypothetical protein
MKLLTAFLAFLVIGCAGAPPVFAQTTSGQACHFVTQYGYVATAGQWTACLNSLQIAFGYTPVNKAGDTMQGPLGITHIFGASGVPTVAAGAGAGTSPTVALNSPSDSDFRLTVTTGSSPTGSNAIIATITFSAAYTALPHCVFSPANSNAANLTAAMSVYGADGAGPPYATWTLISGATALTGATGYVWEVVCLG